MTLVSARLFGALKTGKSPSLIDLLFQTAAYGMMWVSILGEFEGNKKLYCQPPKIVLSGSQVIIITREFVRKEPSAGADDYTLTMLRSLIDAFPCP